LSSGRGYALGASEADIASLHAADSLPPAAAEAAEAEAPRQRHPEEGREAQRHPQNSQSWQIYLTI